MIAWPDENLLRSDGREGLRLFQETAAYAELEASPETWRLKAWPWTHDLPYRVSFENERRVTRTYTLHPNGVWRVTEEDVTYRLRDADALDRDARGELGQRPLQPGHHV